MGCSTESAGDAERQWRKEGNGEEKGEVEKRKKQENAGEKIKDNKLWGKYIKGEVERR